MANGKYVFNGFPTHTHTWNMDALTSRSHTHLVTITTDFLSQLQLLKLDFTAQNHEPSKMIRFQEFQNHVLVSGYQKFGKVDPFCACASSDLGGFSLCFSAQLVAQFFTAWENYGKHICETYISFPKFGQQDARNAAICYQVKRHHQVSGQQHITWANQCQLPSCWLVMWTHTW